MRESLKREEGKTFYEEEVREEGRANINWLRAHGLTEFSAPHEWFESLFSLDLSVDHPCKYESHLDECWLKTFLPIMEAI